MYLLAEKVKNQFNLFLRFSGIILSAFIIILAFKQTANKIIDYWFLDSSYSHGILIAFISAYLFFWHNKNKLLNAQIKPVAFALPLLPIILFFWWSAIVTNIQVLEAASLPLIFLTIFFCLWGKAIGRIALFPVLLFYLAIPIWSLIVNPLQNMTIWVNSQLIEIVRMPAYIEGTNVHIPAGIFSIEQGCAGLKYLLSSLTTIILMGYLSSASIKAKCLAVSLSIFIAIIANWVRVFLIIMIGHSSNMQHSIVNDHSQFGWLIFAVFFLPLLLLCHKLLPVKNKPQTKENIKTPKTRAEDRLRLPNLYQFFNAICIVFLIFITTSYLLPSNISSLTVSEKIDFPRGIAGWNKNLHYSDEEDLPDFKGFSQMASTVYSNVSLSSTLSIIKYQNQKQGAELIHYDNSLFNAEKWQTVEHQAIELQSKMREKPQRVIQEILLSDLNTKRLIFYWYQVGKYSTTSKIQAKILQIPALIARRTDASLYFLSTDCKTDCDQEKQKIKSLAITLMDQSLSII